MRLAIVVDTSRSVADTRSRLEKLERLAGCLRAAPLPLVGLTTAYLAGDLPQGKLGLGYASVAALRDVPAAAESKLTLPEVDATFAAVRAEAGGGSSARRTAAMRALLARATADEQSFLLRLSVGELRQGALEGVLVDAVARAFDADLDAVRRAVMLEGSLPPVAAALAEQGRAGLERFSLRLFRPVQPMLAETTPDVEEALAQLGAAALEYKLDGARVQVHKDGDRVEVWSRAGRPVSAAVPEVIERVRALPARSLILDGETIALDREGRPLPFQITMRRFGRKLDVEAARRDLPLAVAFFDVLRIDDDTVMDRPLRERYEALERITAPNDRVPRIVTASAETADQFLARAMADGHEGVMAKALEAGYRAGRRGAEWLKLKPAHTLDLVVLAAEWGSGRRQGWLSNLHLGARDPERGGFVMLGKTFKGMTDETLRGQTEALLAREIGRDGHIVHVRPELVVEVAFNDVQTSPYPGGVALRFARLRRYRPDKRADEADTIDRVRALLPRARA